MTNKLSKEQEDRRENVTQGAWRIHCKEIFIPFCPVIPSFRKGFGMCWEIVLEQEAEIKAIRLKRIFINDDCDGTSIN